MWAEFSDLNDVLDEFGGGVRGVLGENLCGAYLQGSFAVGDAYEHTDVDVIVVTHEPLAGGDPAALQAVQERIYAMPTAWAQEHGIALVGPDPKELIDPISAADLRAEMVETLRGCSPTDRTRGSRRASGLTPSYSAGATRFSTTRSTGRAADRA